MGKDKVRQLLIRKLKANTIFQNQYNKVHTIDNAGSVICVGSVVSASNELLAEALESGGFIC